MHWSLNCAAWATVWLTPFIWSTRILCLGTKYGRVGWSCGSIGLACLFTSAALLHVVFIYCLRKRLFLSFPAPQALFPCWGEGWSPGLWQSPCGSPGPTGRWWWAWGHRPPHLHSPTAAAGLCTLTRTRSTVWVIILLLLGTIPKGCPGPAEREKGEQVVRVAGTGMGTAVWHWQPLFLSGGWPVCCHASERWGGVIGTRRCHSLVFLN